MPDTGAAGLNTGGFPQFQALQKITNVQLDTSTASKKVRFGPGDLVSSHGTYTVLTPLSNIVFHVLPINTPFLLCLQEIDRLGYYLNNEIDGIVQGDRIVPIHRKYGHP